MNEEWRDIPGFEGFYQASRDGRIRSVSRYVRAVSKAGREFKVLVRGRVLRAGLARGYWVVNLSVEGKSHMRRVNRLVASAFVPNPGNLPEVNHKDGAKANNAAGNLEWMTGTGNKLHAVATGLNSQAVPVVAPSGRTYPSIAQAARGERVHHRTAAEWTA